MSNKSPLIALAAVALISTAPVSVFAADESATSKTKIEDDGNGNYTKKTTSEKTDAAGTVTEQENTTKVKKDSNGNVERNMDSKSSIDPKGLFNKTTEETTDETKVNAD